VDWDNRLLALTPTGSICESFNGTSWTTLAAVNTSETPRGLVVYTDRSENETVYIVTDRSVYAYDPVTTVLIRTRLQFPPHPDNGYGSAVWRPGADLFVSAGIGVYRFNLSAIGAVGLDRDEGLPTEYRGVIRDLCPEHNMLVAYVEGQQTASEVADPDIEFDPGQSTEGEFRMAGTDAFSLLIGWNGFGWHPLWISPTATGDPVWCCVSGAASTYRLWWGFGTGTDDELYTQLLSRPFANPRQEIEASEGDFALDGYLDTGWFDANMQEFRKVASHLEINVETASATEPITVLYRKDFEAAWTLLGNITASGKAYLPFGVSAFDGQPFSYGLDFDRIRFRIEMGRDPSDSTKSPLIDSMVLKYIKVPIDTATFALRIVLDLEHGFEGRGNDEIASELTDILTGHTFVPMSIGHTMNDPFRVRLTYERGDVTLGSDTRGYRDITVLEIPLADYQGRGDES
jgi:hypothetical protein